MKFSALTDRLAQLGSAKWDVHHRAKALQAEGVDVIQLTIGEPDVPTPPYLTEAAKHGIDAGRLGYSNGRGEANLLEALAARYSARTGRVVTRDQILALPGTQTALYATMQTLVEAGDEVLVGDPLYATYEGIISAPGAVMVPVELRPEHGFRMQVEDVAAKLSPRSRVLFLNSPHNPTGAVLHKSDVEALGRFAIEHDLWIISDEVYEEMVFQGADFVSPFDLDWLADRVIVCSSISKSHAAPGFRSGWCVGSEEFSARLQPIAETMLFGNQPFIADMTALAVSQHSPVAAGMAERFSRRASLLYNRLNGLQGLSVHRPEAGMFCVVDIRTTGLTGEEFSTALLEEERVAVMPGESFGTSLNGWLRISLTEPDAKIEIACDRILAFVARKIGKAA